MANPLEAVKKNPLLIVGAGGAVFVGYMLLKNKGNTPLSNVPLYYPGGSQPGTYSPSYIAPLPAPVPPLPPGPPLPHPDPSPYICMPGTHHDPVSGRCVPDGIDPPPIYGCGTGGDVRVCGPFERCENGVCVPAGPPQDQVTAPVLAGMTDDGPMGSIFAFGGKGGGVPSMATEEAPVRETYNTYRALQGMRRYG